MLLQCGHLHCHAVTAVISLPSLPFDEAVEDTPTSTTRALSEEEGTMIPYMEYRGDTANNTLQSTDGMV